MWVAQSCTKLDDENGNDDDDDESDGTHLAPSQAPMYSESS